MTKGTENCNWLGIRLCDIYWQENLLNKKHGDTRNASQDTIYLY